MMLPEFLSSNQKDQREEPSQTNEHPEQKVIIQKLYDDQINSTQETNELLGLCTEHFSGLEGQMKHTESAPKTQLVPQDEQYDDEIPGLCTSEVLVSNEGITVSCKEEAEPEKAVNLNGTKTSPKTAICSSKGDDSTKTKPRTIRRKKRKRTLEFSEDGDAQKLSAFDDEENYGFKDNTKRWKSLDKRLNDSERKTSDKEGMSDEDPLTLNYPHFASKMSPEIINDITRDKEAVYAFLKQHHCIRSTAPNCSICDEAMTWVRRSGDEYTWRCPTHKGQTLTARSGSFWEKSRLPLSALLRLAFFWSFNTTNKDCANYTGLCKNSVMQWYQHFRGVCSYHLEQNPIMIGGTNVIVEIDESVMPERKYSGNRTSPERWIFGGICPATQEGFLVFVPNREAATLLPIIQQHVRPGSIIHTDGWPAYRNIDRINVQPPYIHRTINHSVNLVDPDTGAFTSHVENYWKKAKQKFKIMCGVKRHHLDSYLDEFQWRERFGKHGMEVFSNLLLHISQRYPTP